MIPFDALIFDFDGVLLESELPMNQIIADVLTDLGHPTTLDDALQHSVGHTGREVFRIMEQRIGGPLPDEFHTNMREAGARVLAEGLAPVAGAIEFIEGLPSEIPKAVASSSSTRWIRTHLDHLGLRSAFEPHIYSGREHVERGKPEPDLYIHAARALGVPIERTAIIEDSRVGAIGALASGGTVIGLAAGSHCRDGHEEMLRGLGVEHVAHSFDDVSRMLGLA
ncbi:MAG TPA: HAD family phosphatase [Sphingomicrobium sp.]|jgi:HAD superfamily hydrolase (TIGR01509 family)